MALRVGDEILEGKYRIQGVLGEGAFGKVYLAHDLPLNRQVAIKELRRKDWTQDKYVDFRRRFQREAQIGAALKHDRIVDVYTLEPKGEDFHLVMEYVDGPTLGERLEQEGPLPIHEAVQLAIQLSDGLAAVHEHPLGIVHRDIKPSNILLTSEGHPKITDFGLAQLAAESGRSLGKGGRHPGTPLYMSPEQETTAGYLRPASDIYSLGCVLFETVTGKAYKRVEGTKARGWQPAVPESLDDVLSKMLADDRRSRYLEAAEVKADLGRAFVLDLEARRTAEARPMRTSGGSEPAGTITQEELPSWLRELQAEAPTEDEWHYQESAPPDAEEVPSWLQELRAGDVERPSRERQQLYRGRIRVASWRRDLITECAAGEIVTTMFVADKRKPTGYRVAAPDEQLRSHVILGKARIVSVPGQESATQYKVEIVAGPNKGRTITLYRPWFLNDVELKARQRLAR